MSTLEVLKDGPEPEGVELHVQRPKAGGWLAMYRDNTPYGSWMLLYPQPGQTVNHLANPPPLHATRESAIQAAQMGSAMPPEGRKLKLFKVELE
ncbi:MAG: hypothetical protein ACK5PF_02020 [bacterium]|jgi:hypothetical protein